MQVLVMAGNSCQQPLTKQKSAFASIFVFFFSFLIYFSLFLIFPAISNINFKDDYDKGDDNAME